MMSRTIQPIAPLRLKPSPLRAKTGLLFGVWTIVALFFASRRWLVQAAGYPWWWPHLLAFIEAYLWAIFTPIIFFLANRTSLTRNNWLRQTPQLLIGWLLISAIYLSCFILIASSLQRWRNGQPMRLDITFPFQFRGYFHQCVLVCALVTLAANVMAYYRRLNESERAAAEIKAQLADARLRALQMQLHPHFLFNTLHAISTLIHKDAQLADRMIARLSEFLRLTLENSGAQEVMLRQELEFLHRYLAIEQVRFQERLSLHFDIAPETLGALTPNLILQPLVENAMRHGIATREDGGRIEITAQRADDRLRIQISDSGADETGSKPDNIREGVGLANTRARLQQLYGDDYSFDWRREEGVGFTVELTLPFRQIALEES